MPDHEIGLLLLLKLGEIFVKTWVMKKPRLGDRFRNSRVSDMVQLLLNTKGKLFLVEEPVWNADSPQLRPLQMLNPES